MGGWGWGCRAAERVERLHRAVGAVMLRVGNTEARTPHPAALSIVDSGASCCRVVRAECARACGRGEAAAARGQATWQARCTAEGTRTRAIYGCRSHMRVG